MPLFRVALLACALGVLPPSAVDAIEIWSDCGPPKAPPSFDEVARLVAPVLWFSPDEPLLGPGRDIHKSILPAALPAPGQTPATARAVRLVYYRVSQVRTAPGRDSPADRDKTATRRDGLTIAYIARAGNGGQSDHAVTVNGMGAMRFALSGGWVVPRAIVAWSSQPDDGLPRSARRPSLGADLLYAPSGSRIVDWYVAVGVDGLASAQANQFVQEAGVKLRFPSGPLSWANSLVGLRAGYRGPLHRDLAGGRWVFEAGLGGW